MTAERERQEPTIDSRMTAKDALIEKAARTLLSYNQSRYPHKKGLVEAKNQVANYDPILIKGLALFQDITAEQGWEFAEKLQEATDDTENDVREALDPFLSDEAVKENFYRKIRQEGLLNKQLSSETLDDLGQSCLADFEATAHKIIKSKYQELKLLPIFSESSKIVEELISLLVEVELITFKDEFGKKIVEAAKAVMGGSLS